MARPKKYRTGAALARAVDRYFASISRTVTATEKYDTGEKDSYGHNVFSYRTIFNDAGEEIRYVEYVIPPTVAGICAYLGIHRATWADYCDPMLHPEFHDTTTRARGRMRAYLETQLLTRKDVKGIIFDLQNNHGMRDRQEIELGPRANRALKSVGMSADEKMELLREIMEATGEGDGA